MNIDDKRRVLEKVCGMVVGKYISTNSYRLWAGIFNPDSFCPIVTTIGVDKYFVVEGKNEDDAIILAYERLHRAVKHQVYVNL